MIGGAARSARSPCGSGWRTVVSRNDTGGSPCGAQRSAPASRTADDHVGWVAPCAQEKEGGQREQRDDTPSDVAHRKRPGAPTGIRARATPPSLRRCPERRERHDGRALRGRDQRVEVGLLHRRTTPVAPIATRNSRTALQNESTSPTPIVASARTAAAASSSVVRLPQNLAKYSTRPFPAIVANATRAATMPATHTASLQELEEVRLPGVVAPDQECAVHQRHDHQQPHWRRCASRTSRSREAPASSRQEGRRRSRRAA